MSEVPSSGGWVGGLTFYPQWWLVGLMAERRLSEMLPPTPEFDQEAYRIWLKVSDSGEAGLLRFAERLRAKPDRH